MRKKVSFFNISRGKLRQSWNKYNLYNISKYDPVPGHDRLKTFFQQKWLAKATMRAYHGETLRETHWKRQFNPTLRSVIPMDPRRLARSDGTEQSAGRGSGLDVRDAPRRGVNQHEDIPYTSMVFAALERRLDVAVHRAMFASSTRQARQFVIHGYVKVNGKQMIYPGYRLNPGDMFQVDPERVMYATGAPKDAVERRQARKEKQLAKAERTPGVAEAEAAEQAEAQSDPVQETSQNTAEMLQAITAKARQLLAEDKRDMSASKKRTLRSLQQLVRKAISKGGKNKPLEEAVDEQMLQLMQKLNVAEQEPPAADAATAEQATEPDGQAPKQWMSRFQKEELEKALQELKENPIDLTKPYATPWRPRDFLAPFAYIPRYLEVHHKICSAVYVRHPVARPGLSEVPSPFNQNTSDLAFSWYLRNR